MSTLLIDVEVEGARVDVRVVGDRVSEVGHGLDRRDDEVVDGAGGALLPGLHDHHLHLLALAAARTSIDCRGGLDALASAPGDGWVRGVGLEDSVDRHVLDAVVADRPVRVQHRSGSLWMLNTVALRLVEHVLDASADVERDAGGSPTGRLWRYDDRLRPALPDTELDLETLGHELASLGITSVTDATPGLETFAGVERLPQHVTFLGRRKLLLRDHDLPSYDELCALIAERHGEGLSVAVHCVTRESLVLTLAALDEVGRLPGDRIEHAAVVPPDLVERLRGLRVVTQPGFLADRGDTYLREVHPDDVPHLYRYAGLLAAGVDVVASSDAPYGPLDPWTVLRAARDRRTPAGAVVGVTERVAVRTTLAGYLTDARGVPRRVVPGAVGGLLLLAVGLDEAVAEPAREHVRATWCRGGLVLPGHL
ncbi:amidohydrolase family protein [soil metagenome]